MPGYTLIMRCLPDRGEVSRINFDRLPVNRGKVQDAATELKWVLGVSTRDAAAHQDLPRVPGMLN